MGAVTDTTGRTLWDLVEARSAATPDALMALDQAGRTMTYRRYRDRAERVAAGLAGHGVGEGTNVSWMLPTRMEALVAAAALSRLGAVQNPILPIYRHRETGFITRQTGCRLLIVPGTFRGFDYPTMAREATGDQAAIEVLVADPDLPDGDPASLPPPPSAEGDPVRWLFYSSGTTADPKGARHSDASLFAADDGMQWSMGCTDADRSAVVFPITHVGGVVWLVNTLRTGVRLLLVETFDPADTPRWLAEQGVTCAGAGTVFHLAYLSAQRQLPEGVRLFPDVRLFNGGGAPKPPQLHHDLVAEMGAPVISGWGLTEAPILTMAHPSDPDDKLAHTEGRPVPGTSLRVVTLGGTVAGPGEEGELLVKGPQVCQGYLDCSLDADAFDEDGWFRTGDLGVVDDEGYVRITGRLKDVIIRKGENISAKEVEDVLFTHPKVAEAAVIGLPDPALGERACAVVVANDPADPIELGEMVSFLKEAGLAVQKIPEQLEVVPALPRNPSGKVLKVELRKQYGERGGRG